MAISIPKSVYEAILVVRDSGATNMLDRPRVIVLLEDFGCDEAAEWVRTHKSEYSHGIFQGFQPEEDVQACSGGAI